MLIDCLKQGIKNRNSVLNRVGKSAIFVLNRIRIWGAAPHLPTQGYIEYPPPPDIACLQLKLWWGDDYHIWIPRSNPRVFLLLQPLLLTWYRQPSTQTLVRGCLSHMNSQEYPPRFSYCCNLYYLHDIACLQLKLWWGVDYHIWIPRSLLHVS